MEFQSGYSAQQHGPGIGFSVQTSSVKEDEESARGQLGGKVVAYDQSGHQAGEGQGLLHQLLQTAELNGRVFWSSRIYFRLKFYQTKFYYERSQDLSSAIALLSHCYNSTVVPITFSM